MMPFALVGLQLGACILDRQGHLVVDDATGGDGGSDVTSGGGPGQGGATDTGGGGTTSAGGTGGAVDVGGAGGSAPPVVWSSWEVVVDDAGARVTSDGQIATVELFESNSLADLGVAIAFDQFHSVVHPEAFNKVETYWATASDPNTYPYAGKSTVDRGMDNGEGAVPLPMGVRDLQLHPPDVDRLVAMAFVVPIAGAYTATDVAARRVDGGGDDATLVLHAPCTDTNAVVSVQAGNDGDWVSSGQSHDLGSFDVGDRICFGVSRTDVFDFDATEIAWTLTLEP